MTTARSRRWLARTGFVLVAAVVAGAAMPAAEARPPKGDTARVSEGTKGKQLNGLSNTLGLSADGRSALFSSAATNLLPVDGTPNASEVYVRDLRNGHIERVSVADDGAQLNAPTSDASISGDGRYVAFTTTATNVVPGQAKHQSDVFVRDRWTGRTELITFLPGTTTTGGSYDPVMTSDDRWVYFDSDADNLVPGDTNQQTDVFRRDLWTGRIERVSLTEDGAQATGGSYNPRVDATGDAVVFDAEDGNLVAGHTNTFTDVFLRRL
ncbi:TolB family protein [Kitasatospora sp. NPDC101155]|uniref:TolB family protein n=1 Tax=Kitasatospora sp. NPDC101155 TaxID=3364097 RepID=UPI0038013B32